MSYRQYKTGFTKSLWELEEFNKPKSEESKYKQDRFSARSSPSMTHQRQKPNYVASPRWIDHRIAEFYSYNRAIAVDGGYCRNRVPEKLLEKGCKGGGSGFDICGKMEGKEGQAMIFGGRKGGYEKTIMLRGQKRVVVGNLAYSSCSDSDRCSESDSD